MFMHGTVRYFCMMLYPGCVFIYPNHYLFAHFSSQKAIQDSESEWSQNKKVIDLSRKDIRHAVSLSFNY